MPFLRYFFLAFFLTSLLVVGWAGLRGEKSTKPPIMVFPDMDDQAKVKFQADSDFFADGAGGRKPVTGTVPMGLQITQPGTPVATAVATPVFSTGNDYYNTGRFGDFWGDGLPEQIKIDDALIRRGAERFNIYCSVCHGYSGDGLGITSKYGVPMANGNMHSPAFTNPKDPFYKTDGNIFNTMTYGKGLMGPYGAMITVPDRWAIVAYIRTLQMAKPAAPAPVPPVPATATPGSPTPATTPAPAAPAAPAPADKK